MYTTKKVKAPKTPKLDILASEAGRAYSKKVSGFILSPVVGVMASPIGVRFHPHLCKHAS